MKPTIPFYLIAFAATLLLATCTEKRTDSDLEEGRADPDAQLTTDRQKEPGQKSQLELGEHLVLITGCHDCHTPKKMTDHGPEPDFSLALSGHPANMPPPDVNRAEVEKKGLAVTQSLTAWVGPWGISYASNLTSDQTGIGSWSEQNFIVAIREGKAKGLRDGRTLLPPMPWQMFANMTDEELKAIFAYLKATKPINNAVPPPEPPLAAAGQASR